MISKLVWNKLLSIKRQRESCAMTESKNETESMTARNDFEADYDRIVGSSSVRRLQDKAQVFPLQENDFTRTRLTHSIEVSALARSLGKAVGKQLEKKEVFTAEMTDQFAALLQTAGLIHDLGNPPFGHYGESVIRRWFENWFQSDEFRNIQEKMTIQEKNDFIYFDGNVQNLRIVTKLQTLNDKYGANFTYATLATIIKYPWGSDGRPSGKSKYGYFKSEENIVKKIQKEVGLEDGIRHPATYLLEAADDIIYICDDIEDGTKKGYIDWEKEYNDLKKVILKESGESKKYVELFLKIDNKKTDSELGNSEVKLSKVRNFRNYTQGYLLERAVEEFIKSYDKIMEGTYEYNELLHEESLLIDKLKEITAENCFACHEVLALELVGDKVIKTLLDIFVETLVFSSAKDLLKSKTYAGKIYKLISPNFTYIALNENDDKSSFESNYERLDALSVYDRLHLAVDFISGMTDSYAVNLYKELMGIKLPY